MSGITLVPAERAHEGSYWRWFNNFPVQRTSGLVPEPWNRDRFKAWFTRRVMLGENETWFTIVDSESGQVLGFAGVRDIDHLNRTAEFFIMIGEADARGRGVGTEATRLTVEYGFTELNLHNIFLNVSGASLAGIRAYEKAGFRVIGRRTECVVMGGRAYDEVMMECLPPTGTAAT